MPEAGKSARQTSERMHARRTLRLRRRWPLVVVAGVAVFLLGFYLPRILSILFSAFLEAIAPDSGGVELQTSLGLRVGVGGVLALAATIGLLRPSQSEEAWRKGASAETRVGRILDSLVPAGVWVIHDKKIPGSRANIDHLVVTQAGVLTIDTKAYSGKLEVRGRGRQLWINGRNRSKLLEQAQGQAEAVRGVLALDYPDVPVYPVLCLVGTAVPLLFPPREIGGVLIWTSRNLSKRLLRGGPNQLYPDQVKLVTLVIDEGLR